MLVAGRCVEAGGTTRYLYLIRADCVLNWISSTHHMFQNQGSVDRSTCSRRVDRNVDLYAQLDASSSRRTIRYSHRRGLHHKRQCMDVITAEDPLGFYELAPPRRHALVNDCGHMSGQVGCSNRIGLSFNTTFWGRQFSSSIPIRTHTQ